MESAEQFMKDWKTESLIYDNWEQLKFREIVKKPP